MNDNFNTMEFPDINTFLNLKLQSSNNNVSFPTSINDPYQIMLRKNKNIESVLSAPIIQTWPDKDVLALQSYCQSNGILGYNCGKMNPKIALSMLKQQFGDFSEVPLEDRVIDGYQKIGTEHITPSTKQLLLG